MAVAGISAVCAALRALLLVAGFATGVGCAMPATNALMVFWVAMAFKPLASVVTAVTLSMFFAFVVVYHWLWPMAT